MPEAVVDDRAEYPVQTEPGGGEDRKEHYEGLDLLLVARLQDVSGTFPALQEKG